jgi:hypothetical protein
VLASGARAQANALTERKETTAESEYEWGAMWMEGKGSCQNGSGTSLVLSFGGHGLGQIGQQLAHPAPACSWAHNGSEGHR